MHRPLETASPSIPYPIAHTLGGRLRAARRDRGVSLRQLAAETGISHQQLHKYEQDQVTPPRARLETLAGALNMPVDAAGIPHIGREGGGAGGALDFDLDLILDQLPAEPRRRVAVALRCILAALSGGRLKDAPGAGAPGEPPCRRGLGCRAGGDGRTPS